MIIEDNLEKESKPRLISIRVKQAGIAPVEGAVSRPCSACGASVWVAPSAVDWDVTLICMRCARKLPRADFQKMTDAQRIEIFKQTGLYGWRLDRIIEKIQNEIWP